MHKKKHGHSHTGKQAKGDNMHIHSAPKPDKFASPGEHAGPKDWHLGPHFQPGEDYQDGGESENENCEYDK